MRTSIDYAYEIRADGFLASGLYRIKLGDSSVSYPRVFMLSAFSEQEFQTYVEAMDYSSLVEFYQNHQQEMSDQEIIITEEILCQKRET